MKNEDLTGVPKVPPFLEGASSRSVMELKNSLKNSISTSTVTPEMLERIHGNIVKRANAHVRTQMGKILKIYFR
jgi:hypothetical protein